jgi:uncharacterized RDD family membrane protein YckC
MEKSQLAGFGNRLVAQIIDGIIVGIALMVILIPFGGVAAMLGLGASDLGNTDDAAAAAAAGIFGAGLLTFIGLSIIVPFFYEAFMLSSSKQATLGKMLMKIKVVGQDGQALTFGQAFGRSLIKYITGNLCTLLWLWPLFNPEEQALHDLVGKSFVIRS